MNNNLTRFVYEFVFQEGDRIYLIGKDRIRVPKRVIDKIIDWNEKQCDDISVDKKIFKSLILCLVTPERLAEGHIDKHVKNFIYGEKNIR